jgi:diguanylate cyclase (GGDEF)-like protein
MHSPTLVIAVLVLVAVVTGILFFAWRSNRDIEGLREWFLGYLAALVNICLFLAKPPVPPFMAVFALQALFMCTGLMALLGVHRYLQYPQIHGRWIGWSVACGFLVILFSALHDVNSVFSFGVGSVATGIYLLWSAKMMWDKASEQYPARKFFAIALFLHGTFTCFRVLLFTGGVVGPMFAHVWWNNAQLILVEQLIMSPILGLGVLLLVNEKHVSKLKFLAEQDFLTGIFNRRAFLGALQRACDQAQKTKQPLSILVMDVDHFKNINDTHGHSAGDEVLKKITSLINGSLRHGDVLGRVGGEEFAVFLPDTDANAALAIAQRIRARVCSEPLMLDATPMACSVSIGVSVLKEGDSMDDALRYGDRAMYLAKTQGRNRVEYV